MKIYFACSIRGGRNDATIYVQLVAHIKQQAELLTEVFADNKLTPMGINKPSSEIWQQDLAWVKEADAIIAEVTQPSLGVGYEVAKAEEWGKPILALYKEQKDKRLSAMIDGSPHTKTVYYNDVIEAQQAIDGFLQSIGH